MNIPIHRALIVLSIATVLSLSCSPREDETAEPSPEKSLSKARLADSGTGDTPSSLPATIPHALSGSPAFSWAAAIEQDDGEWAKRFREAGTPQEKAEVIEAKLTSGPDGLAPLLKRALLESADPVRIDAVQATPILTETDEIVAVLTAALYDTSEDVRRHALDMIHDSANMETQLQFFENALSHPLVQVKDEAMLELGRYSSPEAFDVMLEGLKDPDPAYRAVVIEHLKPFVQQQSPDRTFSGYDDARRWWNANRKNYDENMTYVSE